MDDITIDIPDINLPTMVEIDADIDFDISDFQLLDDDEQTRILKPKMARSAVYTSVGYARAQDMAENVDLTPGSRTTVIVPGNFIFGDLLEALILDRGIDADELIVSSLSMSEDNVDSLKNIMICRPELRLTLVVSGYFFSHYKHDLIPYIYQELDVDDRFQIAFTNTHMKIALIHSKKGRHYCLTGSANLRSSSSLEQFDLEESEQRYSFFRGALMALVEKYKTIDYNFPNIKGGMASWQAVLDAADAKEVPQ